MKWLLVVAVLSVASADTALAQSSAASADGHRLRPGVDSFVVHVVRGVDTSTTGSIIDELRIEGDRLVRIYTTVDRVLGNRLDTIVSGLGDLQPMSNRSRSSRLRAELTFTSRSVDGWLRLVNQDSIPVHVPITSPTYDGAAFDLVVRASDLREGLKISVPSFLVGTNTVALLGGHVSASDEIDGRPCWMFAATFGETPVTFWIDKETRALRRQVLQVRVDMSVVFVLQSARAAKRPTTSS